MNARSIVFPRGMVRAAGAVVWRPAKKGKPIIPGAPVAPTDFEVLLVHRPSYRDWSWPKGKAEKNETAPVAAVREVEEETGQAIVLGAPLTTQRYRLGSGHLKEIYYWSGALLTDGPALAVRKPVARAHKKEIDIVQWVSPDRARAMLTRRGDRRLLTELINRAARGDLITSTTILQRHARAVSRERWPGSEADRPLTRLGAAQSLDLVPILSAFGAAKVTSSPWKRCAQTVSPYATLGLANYSEKTFLTEDGAETQPEMSSALVARFLAKKQGARLISLHRPGYQALLAPVREITSGRIMADIEQPKKNLRRGEMLVLHVSHSSSPRVVAAERHLPFTQLTI